MSSELLSFSSPAAVYIALFQSVLIFPLWLFLVVPIALLSFLSSYFANKLLKRRHIILAKESVEEIIKSTNRPDNVASPRSFDVVLFGATGFTGKLAAEYIARNYGLKSFKWAIAGRRFDALQKLRSELATIDPQLENLMIIVAESSDQESISRLVASCKVVLSTAGPFAKYGSPIVRYCAAYGTHYCDITGETDWVREMIDRYDDLAKSTGARIVPHCGHDCVPYDLTVMACANELKKHSDRIIEINLCDEVFSAPSGGTLATAVHSLTERVVTPSTLGFDPLLKDSSGKKSTSKLIVQNVSQLTFSSQHNAWLGPFIMAAVNANCVRRSQSLLNYNDKLIYREGIVFPSFAAGLVYVLNLVYFGSILFTRPLRSLFMKFGAVPNPGEGPSNETMEKGYLRVHGYGKGMNGKQCKSEFFFATDPGYRDTARMLVESGLVLVLNESRVNVSGGFWTPASCFGDALIDRLVATGSSFEISVQD